jgi:hypothetical protein
MVTDAKLFTIRLTDDERATLEEARRSLGLRSEADAFRRILTDWAGGQGPAGALDAGKMLKAQEAVALRKPPPVPYGSRLKKPK